MYGNLKPNFVRAYCWMYGSTKKQAETAYRRAMEIADYDYIREIIACFDGNAKRAFVND